MTPRRLRLNLVVLAVSCMAPGAALVLGQAPYLQVAALRLPAAGQTVKEARAEMRKQAVAPPKMVVVQKAMIVQPGIVAPMDPADQFVESLRPMFHCEYYFICGVCNPTSAQRKQIARLGERVTRAVSRQLAQMQKRMEAGGIRPGQELPEPRRLMSEAVGKELSIVLSPEQMAIYTREVAARETSRRQAFIDNFVAALDDRLVLLPEQREKLAAALSANWQNTWGQSIQLLQNLESYFPSIPDSLMRPILTDAQMKAWSVIPKSNGVFWGINFVQMGLIGPLDDPELREAEEEARTNAAKTKE